MTDYFDDFDYDPEFDDEEEDYGCDFGPEFCEHPDIKSMNLCTTECPLYFELVKESEEYHKEQQMDIQEYVIQNGKCCACEAPLKDSAHVNMVMISKKAMWKYPIWGNILAKEDTAMGYACGIVCDNCVDNKTGQIKKPIKYAIEVQGGDKVAPNFHTARVILYHDVNDLEDGEPEIPRESAEAMALQMKADLERDQLLNAITGILPDDPVAVAYRGAMEEANENMLRQSANYLMLINQTYVNSLRNPDAAQHHDAFNQLAIAAERQMPTIMIFDETITPEDREYVKQMTAKLNVKAEMTHDFRVQSAELHEKVRQLLVSFEDHAPPECRANCPWVDACPREYMLRSCPHVEEFKEKGLWGNQNV